MTRARRSAVPPVCAHRCTCPARSLAPCPTHPRTSDSHSSVTHAGLLEGAKGAGITPESSAELLLGAREEPYGGRRGKERRVRAQRCRRGPGRAEILGLAPRYAPNGFGRCSPAVSRPCSALLPRHGFLPTTAHASHPRSGRRGPIPVRPPHRGPRAAPARRRPRSISRSLLAGGREDCSGRGRRNRHMPRQASPPPYGKRGRAGHSGGRPMCSAARRDAATCGSIKPAACALAPRLHSMAGDIS